jgi:hypothetical protein
MNDETLELALSVLDKYLETKSPTALLKFWQLFPRPIASWHLKMMNDESRNSFYRQEINHKAKDQIVIDLGCGSGLLTMFALEAGAKHIYAIEQHPILQRCFNHTFKKEIESGKVTLLAKSSQDVTLEDFKSGTPNLIIHEIFGTSLFDEKVIETFHDLLDRKIIDTSMEFIPQKFSLWGCFHEQDFESKIKDQNYSEKFWFLEDISFFGIPSSSTGFAPDSADVSPDFEVFSVDLKKSLSNIESTNKILTSAAGCFLRLWFELEGEKSTLSTNMRVNEDNHWGNAKYFIRFPRGEVNIKSTYNNGKFLTYLVRS